MTSSDGTNPNERGVGLDTLLATRLDEDEVRALTTVMFGPYLLKNTSLK